MLTKSNTNLTDGTEKILLRFERFIETDSFKEEAGRIREALHLPENGFDSTNVDVEKLANPKWLPEKFMSDFYRKIFTHNTPSDKYDRETRKLLNHLPVESKYLSALVKGFVFYNKFYSDELKKYLSLPDIAEIDSAQSELEAYSLNDDPDSRPINIQGHTDALEERTLKYPVVVRIHADASQRNIVEFIQKNWSTIEMYQKGYVDPNKKASIKNSWTKINKKERDDFIYKHKHLKPNEIMRLVGDIYGPDGVIDYAYISKIISLEKKRRKA